MCACMSTDPDGLPKLSEKQRRHLDHWVRPDDICEDPKMVYLVSSFTVKQVMYIISVVCFNGNVHSSHIINLVTFSLYRCIRIELYNLYCVQSRVYSLLSTCVVSLLSLYILLYSRH